MANRQRTSLAQTDAPGSMRDQVKQVAKNLYVLRGFSGFSFGDIAAAVGTTRANIHHHYGSKGKLVGELIADFVNDAESRIASHWTDDDVRLTERLRLQLADLRAFYTKYNPSPGDRNVWSPLSRIRLDLLVLGDIASKALERSDQIYDAALKEAVKRAIAAGELTPETPVADVARLLRVTILSCAPMTQDTGSFRELEKLFGALERTILAAWGTRRGGTR
jgi:AcrR family transcriptional regulator